MQPRSKILARALGTKDPSLLHSRSGRSHAKSLKTAAKETTKDPGKYNLVEHCDWLFNALDVPVGVSTAC